MFVGIFRLFRIHFNIKNLLEHSSLKMLGENQETPAIQGKNRSVARLQTESDLPASHATAASRQKRTPLGDITSKHGNVACMTTKGMGGSTINRVTGERPRTIVVEGNIGSGKSTLLNYFSQKDDIEVFPEPVHKWRENKGHNLLDLFYKDPNRWSFAFETYAQFTRLQVHEAKTSCRVKLMERSIYSGKYCFTENLYKSKQLEKPEYNVLCEWFDWLITTKDLHIDHIVYMRSTPELCQRRIIERSRNEESTIPLDYLRDLHQTHEDWLINRTKFELPAPVLILDATKNLEDMVQEFRYMEGQLQLQTL